MRTSSKQTASKWIACLNEVKSELNSNNFETLTQVFRKHNINQLWKTFLKDHNVIYKQNGYFKWNEKFSVSIKLIEYFRMYSNELGKKSRINKINNEQNLFTMPSSPLPKPPKVTKTRKPRVEVKFYDEPKNELGLIRKFWKWIY